MKHHTPSLDPKTAIVGGAAAFGVELSEAQAAILAEHLDHVLVANARLNLTRIDTPEEAVRLHVLDSLTAANELLVAPVGQLADLGSGAGFPGIPLAVVSGRATTLVESVRKKAAFLVDCVSRLGLEGQVRVYPGRAEHLARESPCGYAAITARALSSVASLLELASPLLVRGGRLIALKGLPDVAEIARGDEVAGRVGLERCGLVAVKLPGGDESRTILVYEKVAESSVALPRREGMAQRSPLA